MLCTFWQLQLKNLRSALKTQCKQIKTGSRVKLALQHVLSFFTELKTSSLTPHTVHIFKKMACFSPCREHAMNIKYQLLLDTRQHKILHMADDNKEV